MSEAEALDELDSEEEGVPNPNNLANAFGVGELLETEETVEEATKSFAEEVVGKAMTADDELELPPNPKSAANLLVVVTAAIDEEAEGETTEEEESSEESSRPRRPNKSAEDAELDDSLELDTDSLKPRSSKMSSEDELDDTVELETPVELDNSSEDFVAAFPNPRRANNPLAVEVVLCIGDEVGRSVLMAWLDLVGLLDPKRPSKLSMPVEVVVVPGVVVVSKVDEDEVEDEELSEELEL